MSESPDKKINSILHGMMENFVEFKRKQFLASYCLADKKEREARIDAIIDLSAELAEVRKKTRFATLLYRQPIEDIILGDWESAERYLSMLSFEDEHEDIRKEKAPIWARFREILECAVIAAKARRSSSSTVQ